MIWWSRHTKKISRRDRHPNWRTNVYFWNDNKLKKKKTNKPRSVQRTQTPPRLWPLTCELDLMTMSGTPIQWNLISANKSFIFIRSTCWDSGIVIIKSSNTDFVSTIHPHLVVSRSVSASTFPCNCESWAYFHPCEFAPTQNIFAIRSTWMILYW